MSDRLHAVPSTVALRAFEATARHRSFSGAANVIGQPPIVVGNGAGSGLVDALKGEAPFGRDLDPSAPGAVSVHARGQASCG